jgi:NAD(P)-dependent dehydrogenase (short-subunit alcohol dehydrogenase family)
MSSAMRVASPAAAKAGIVGFAKSAVRELGPDGITINCVLPGPIDTPMLASLSDEARHKLADNPVGRLGTADDAAHAICFLASREAGFISGATLLLTGGDYV